MNRARSWLCGSPNLKLHMGFNGWETGAAQLDLKPTSLWRGDGVDWHAARPSPNICYSVLFQAYG